MKRSLLIGLFASLLGYNTINASTAAKANDQVAAQTLTTSHPPVCVYYITHATLVQPTTTNTLISANKQQTDQEQDLNNRTQQESISLQEQSVPHYDLAKFGKEELEKVGTWIGHNKKYIAIGTIAVCYVLYCYMAYRTKSLLQNKSAWCNWEYPISLETNKSLATNLVRKIHVTYTQLSHLKNYNTPIALFLKDVAWEKSVLNSYLQCMGVGSLVSLYTLLPGGDMRVIVQEKIKTLSILESVLLEWVHAHQERLLQEGI